jgi:N-acetylglucosamine kinase-like BadF-type ATPase
MVLDAAEQGDPVASHILHDQAAALAAAVAAVARQLDLMGSPTPLALAGGVLVRSDFYRRRLLSAIEAAGVHPDDVSLVSDPALGAIHIARSLLPVSN